MCILACPTAIIQSNCRRSRPQLFDLLNLQQYDMQMMEYLYQQWLTKEFVKRDTGSTTPDGNREAQGATKPLSANTAV